MQNYVFILKPTRIYLRKLLQKSAEFAWDDHQKHSKLLPKSANMRLLKQKIWQKRENMQKSWRKTKNRCKRKRKKWRNEGICHPKTGDAGPKTGDLGTPKRPRSPYKQHAQKVKKPQQHALKGQEAHSSNAQKAKKPTAARPERAEALSPGQRPGYNGNEQCAL